MRNKYAKINTILHITGLILTIHTFVFAVPIITMFAYSEQASPNILKAFVSTALLSLLMGSLMVRFFKIKKVDTAVSMISCALSWIAVSLIGSLPYMMILNASFVDSFFEAVSGYTTTGITLFSGLNYMPKSILIWRAVTQWVGGLGILSFFLAVASQTKDSHVLFSAESHKISSKRPRPNIFSTIKILWIIYISITAGITAALYLQGTSVYDAVYHAFTTISTGGFSPYDESIAYYSMHPDQFPNYKGIEYTITLGMILGGTNFLILYHLGKGKIKALWDNFEMRVWWGIIAGAVLLIMIEIFKTGVNDEGFEKMFRHTIFQVSAIITTTGYGTKDIAVYPAMSKFIFLLLMFSGGCVGSTGGGYKIMRIGMLGKIAALQIKKIYYPRKAVISLHVDGDKVSEPEVTQLVSLLVLWFGFLIAGTFIGSFFADLTPLKSFSGISSALGNVGPCYISVADMIKLPDTVKLTYLISMLAGRLEIFPILFLFYFRSWYR